jgi:hypothetical protein
MTVRTSPDIRVHAKQIALGYIIVIILLGIFVIILVHGHRLHADLGQPTWAIAIAVILILPLFVPTLLRYLGPRIIGIKIGSILELSLQQMKESTYSTNDLETGLSRFKIEVLSVPEYENVMSDASIEIIKHIDIIRNNRYEVLVVDLKKGNAWVSPNLYFLALLLLRRTEIKQIAFIETVNGKDEFVGMCSPEEIIETFGIAYPEYKVAANSVCFTGLDMVASGIGEFFRKLRQQWEQNQIQDSHKEWITSSLLNRLMKTSLHTDKIEYEEILSAENLKFIVLAENSYVAVVHGNELQLLINRDKVALKIAQDIMTRTLK